jgi:chromosome segregation ATPase
LAGNKVQSIRIQIQLSPTNQNQTPINRQRAEVNTIATQKMMSFQRVAFLASLFVSAQYLNVSGFSANPLSSQRLPQSTTILREGNGVPESSAAAKAAELKRKAEDAKRKAEELKRVAEAKAAAAMKAVKQANDKAQSSGGTEAAAQQMIAQETQKMNAQADAVKEASNKASARVVIKEGAIIPINESTIEFTAGVLGGTAALIMGGGPVLAVVAAAAANYLSKKNELGEVNELVQGISRASLETFNWFAKLDSKYSLLGKLQQSLNDSIEKLKNSSGENAETIASIEKTVSQTTKQLQDLAAETDFFEGTKQLLGAAGDVIETSVDKAASANKEYKLTERASEALKSAIDKAKASE